MKTRLILLLVMVALLLVAMTAPAFAQADPGIIDKDVVTLDVSLLALLSGFIVPILTAIVTTKWSASALKAVVTAVLAVLAGSIAVWIEHAGHADISQFGMAAFEAAIVAWASYYGFWKPTGITPGLQSATASFGIGERQAA